MIYLNHGATFILDDLVFRQVCEYQGGAFVSALLLATRGGHLAVCQVAEILNGQSGRTKSTKKLMQARLLNRAIWCPYGSRSTST